VASKDDEEQRSPWAKPAFVLSGAFVLGAIVLGLWLVIGAGANNKPNTVGAARTSLPVSRTERDSATSGTRPATVTGSNGSQASNSCHVPPGSQQVLTVAPSGITWQLWHSVALPYSKTSGPQAVQGDLARCYAHSPLGALLATAQISERLGLSNNWETIIDDQVVPGPDRDALLRLAKQTAQATAPPTGSEPQLAAFLFVTYSPQVAVIDIVDRFDNGVMQMAPYTANWYHGDWRLLAQPSGVLTPPAQQLNSTVGYVMWGGV
jgi:hypothetical protein